MTLELGAITLVDALSATMSRTPPFQLGTLFLPFVVQKKKLNNSVCLDFFSSKCLEFISFYYSTGRMGEVNRFCVGVGVRRWRIG